MLCSPTLIFEKCLNISLYIFIKVPDIFQIKSQEICLKLTEDYEERLQAVRVKLHFFIILNQFSKRLKIFTQFLVCKIGSFFVLYLIKESSIIFLIINL